jgi:hypothetical protein
MFGPNAYISIEAQEWHTWIRENFKELQDIRSIWDKDLAVKIEIAISEQFNRIFKAAMIGVPDESLFAPSLREGILHRTHNLDLPQAVKDIINNSNKRKTDQKTSNPSTAKRSRTTSIKVTHDNQPPELKMTPDQYRNKATPYIQANKQSIPKYNNDTDECMKYCLLGYCNTDCARKAAHNRVEKGTRRYQRILSLKQAISSSSTSNRNQSGQDFPDGEAN